MQLPAQLLDPFRGLPFGNWLMRPEHQLTWLLVEAGFDFLTLRSRLYNDSSNAVSPSKPAHVIVSGALILWVGTGTISCSDIITG